MSTTSAHKLPSSVNICQQAAGKKAKKGFVQPSRQPLKRIAQKLLHIVSDFDNLIVAAVVKVKSMLCLVSFSLYLYLSVSSKSSKLYMQPFWLNFQHQLFGMSLSLSNLPALAFRSGRCLGVNAQIFSKFFWGKCQESAFLPNKKSHPKRQK